MYELLLEELNARRGTLLRNCDFHKQEAQLAAEQCAMHEHEADTRRRLLEQIDKAIHQLGATQFKARASAAAGLLPDES